MYICMYTFVVTKVRIVTDIAIYILIDLCGAGALRLAILLRSGGLMFQLFLIVHFDF